MARFEGRKILVAGGGDSALDWVLSLQPKAASMALIHHRDGFRAAPDSVSKMRALLEAGKIELHIAKLKALKGEDGALSAVVAQSAERGEYEIPCDTLLAFYGLTMKLGPVGGFGYAVEENLIRVDTEKFQTSIPGIFAIGDIITYPGKLKLILAGFAEAAAAAHAIYPRVHPGEALHFEYSTSRGVPGRK
jgi:thioredoxin reductase (NADPH)